MQPYIFPYLGYFQLVQSVNTFVFFDDVNYIKKGWINKNNILINNAASKFSIPIKDASQNKLINQVELSDFISWREKFRRSLEMAYKKAPYFRDTFELVSAILNKPHNTISEVAKESVTAVSHFLSFSTEFKNSSDIDYNKTAFDGQQKIIEICKLQNAATYINPINGKPLYDKELFSQNNIELLFIRMNDTFYKQFISDNFISSLSIIDVLMFNSKEEIQRLAQNYILE